MIQFERIRLAGFKSFVDSSELVIEPGLTGVVGPNGCGKSNLVEALRWAMGETSAKQMRGADMDDVIFGGTQSRPARNLAEVVIELDNRERVAPAMFNDHDRLEVMRRIERGQGSHYKVNGREVRARDVALLFADAATGARSTAMVSQGRIGAIINAKPADRRSLLEEAAGISGLHTRRHEAEIRLKAAEANLARLDDVLVTLEAQMQSLSKQAKQASRYRTINDQIRSVEARLLHLRWQQAIDALDGAEAAQRAIEVEVGERTSAAAQAATRQADAASSLPALRQAEAEASAKFQRLLVAGEQLDAEEKRVAEARAEITRRLLQIAEDGAREDARAQDGTQALERLAGERLALIAAGEGEAEAQQQVRDHLSQAAQQVNVTEAELSHLTERVAAEEARRNALERRKSEIGERLARLTARVEELRRQIGVSEAEAAEDAEVIAAQGRVDAAVTALEEARNQAEASDRLRDQADQARLSARGRLQEEQAQAARLKAEADGLQALLEASLREGTPVLDAIDVTAGYEAALGAALGEDLEAPADEVSPHRWSKLDPYDHPPALPAGVRPLSDLVKAPPELARRLSQTGLVEDGRALMASLSPGQRLVSAEGALWRWDGFVIAAGAPSAAATRLQTRNRLTAVKSLMQEAELRHAQADAEEKAASQAAAAAGEAAKLCRDLVRQAEAESQNAVKAQAHLMERAQLRASKLAGLRAQAEQTGHDVVEAETQLNEAGLQVAELPDPSVGRQLAANLREKLGAERSALLEARAAHDRLMREAGERTRRLETVEQDIASWTSRLEEALRHKGELDSRRAEATAEEARLAALPGEIAERRERLLSEKATAEASRREAADALAVAEASLSEADRQLKAAEHDLARVREDRVRRESAVEQGKQLCRSVAERIAERLECTPEQIAESHGIGIDEKLPEPDDLERKLERLVRERDGMGPVNLRAETESEELGLQIESLKTEREDLINAIARLRQGISELNREGRERLLASFKAVDQHFRDLFVRLFGGGRAHLTLTEADDPLDSGLEIMASPPGKKLQVLSLLSGGEQALTALALLFAVFMTNPAPICVLDEVDAPLDDANVDRFCSLLSQITETSKTRFMVVTHHRMTMARMDRLFGVTMSERGISRLVSVDLRTAERLRDAS
ncbi:MAG: chromosome segregation protein SMC [Alphaproteobacteria bacterium]|nr:chromosome segregation protein SMC [Alphaproteobacteria bacterium]